MNDSKLIMDLCEIIDRQNIIIRVQALALEQLDAMTMENEIAEAQQKYEEIWRGRYKVSPQH